MLSIEECKKYLEEYDLTDAEVEEFRNGIHAIISSVFDNYERQYEKETK